MSKAFDTVKRNTLTKDLHKILDRDEMNMMKIQNEDVSLKVRIGSTPMRSNHYTDRNIARGLSKPNSVYFVLGTSTRRQRKRISQLCKEN